MSSSPSSLVETVDTDLAPVGHVSRGGRERTAFLFENLGVTLQLWSETGERGDEVGVRVEIQHVRQRPAPTEFGAVEILLHEPVWRADLFGLATARVGNLNRAHYHSIFFGTEPVERQWSDDLSRDPIAWLGDRLDNVEEILVASGNGDLVGAPDSSYIRNARPRILNAVELMLLAVRAGLSS